MLKCKFPSQLSWYEPNIIVRMSENEFENNWNNYQGKGNVDVSEDTNNGIYIKPSLWMNDINDRWISKIWNYILAVVWAKNFV